MNCLGPYFHETIAIVGRARQKNIISHWLCLSCCLEAWSIVYYLSYCISWLHTSLNSDKNLQLRTQAAANCLLILHPWWFLHYHVNCFQVAELYAAYSRQSVHYPAGDLSGECKHEPGGVIAETSTRLATWIQCVHCHWMKNTRSLSALKWNLEPSNISRKIHFYPRNSWHL